MDSFYLDRGAVGSIAFTKDGNKKGYLTKEGCAFSPYVRLNDYLKMTVDRNTESSNIIAKIINETNKSSKHGYYYKHDIVINNKSLADRLNKVFKIIRELGKAKNGEQNFNNSEDFSRVYANLIKYSGSRDINKSTDKHLCEKFTIDGECISLKELIIEIQEVFGFYFFDADEIFFNYKGENSGYDYRAACAQAGNIINVYHSNQKNQENNYKDACERKEKLLLQFNNFDKIIPEFRAYEESLEKAYKDSGVALTHNIKITKRMCRKWNEIKKKLTSINEYTVEQGENIIDEFKDKFSKEIGDVNFFKWLIDKPYLWESVNKIKELNSIEKDIESYGSHVKFNYPQKRNIDLSGGASGRVDFYLETLKSEDEYGIIWIKTFVPKKDIDALKRCGLAKSTKEIYNILNVRTLIDRQKSGGILNESEIEYLNNNKNLIKKNDIDDCFYEKLKDSEFRFDSKEKIPEIVRGLFSERLPINVEDLVAVYVKYNFKIDSRLYSGFKYVKREGIKDEKYESQCIVYNDKNTKCEESIIIKSIKLTTNGDRCELGFCCNYDGVRKEKNKLIEKVFEDKKFKGVNIEKDTVLVSIDKGLRNRVAYAVFKFSEEGKWNLVETGKINVEYLGVEKFSEIHNKIRKSRKETAAIKKALSKQDKVRIGSGFAKHSRIKESNMTTDMCNKVVSKLINNVIIPYGASVVCEENLKGFKGDSGKTKSQNKIHQKWHKGKISERIMQYSGVYNYSVMTVNAAYTSKACSKCGSLGVRVDKYGNISQCGAYFWCPNENCEHHAFVDADENAAVNIGRKGFYSEILPIFKDSIAKSEKEKKNRKAIYEELDNKYLKYKEQNKIGEVIEKEVLVCEC